MKTKRKALLLSLSALLLVAVSVMGTIAYLTATSDPVVNTFTVGSVDLTLDESVVDDYGVPVEPASRLPKGNNYKLIPGREYTKDPVVHVTSGSEKSYIFVKVENGLVDIEAVAANATSVDTTIATQMSDNGWILYENNIYRYNGIVDGTDPTQNLNLEVFETFTVTKTANETMLSGYTTANITITAYAIQADGLTAADAYDALFPSTTP